MNSFATLIRFKNITTGIFLIVMGVVLIVFCNMCIFGLTIDG